MRGRVDLSWMRAIATLLALMLLAAAFVAVRGQTQTPRELAGDGPLYLALGDSLGASMQPDASGRARPTTAGYTQAIWRAQAKKIKGLRLVTLARGGATATTMLERQGARPSQLAQAQALLRTGKVAFITIDVGANEVEGCRSGDGFDPRCVRRGLKALRSDLPRILRGLRSAGGRDVRIVGMNYYNSFLGPWVTGAAGRRLAQASVPVENAINRALLEIYRAAGVPMADVAKRFATNDFRIVRTRRHGRVPLSVANTCRWTWACSNRDDDHANSAGYRVIASVVLQLLA